MTFDGITLHAVVAELKAKLLNGHIKKINQIGPSQITMSFYAHGMNQLLYLSCDSSSGRIHLTEKKYTNPLTPPDFVMLLRKHLGQGKLICIDQVGLDRTVALRFETHNELGDTVIKKLILEIMGRHSNLILVDQNEKVVEAVRRVSHDMSRVRQIYPGKRYEVFPADKQEVLADHPSVSELVAKAQETEHGGMTVKKIFYGSLTGFSPLASTELCVRADVDPAMPIGQLTADQIQALDAELCAWTESLRTDTYRPALYRSPKLQAYPFALTHYGAPEKESDSISAMIDLQTVETARDDGFGQKKDHLRHRLAEILEKKNRKLENLKKDEAETENRQTIKEEADLLAAYAHTVQKGQTEIVVDDFFHDNTKRSIPLDPKKTGHENMDAKYKHFSKLNTAHKILLKSIPQLQGEIQYLEQLGEMLEQTEDSGSLNEVWEEFEREGLLPRKKRHKKANRSTPLPPREYTTRNGLIILVGRNNFQNDRLTLKIADKEDYFFHAKTVPGAHVILRCGGNEPSQEDIQAAAWLAAKYSSQAQENAVDIDFTQKKHVYKAKGAKPGMVYYKEFQTLTMNPQATPDFFRVTEKNENEA